MTDPEVWGGDDTRYPGISAKVRAVIDLYGPTNLLTRRKMNADGTESADFNDDRAGLMLGGDRHTHSCRWRDVSPVNQVREASPPVLIVHGESDSTVGIAQATELAAALRAAHVPLELVILKNVGPMFDFDPWRGHALPGDLRKITLDFLARYLSPVSAAPYRSIHCASFQPA